MQQLALLAQPVSGNNAHDEIHNSASG